jgi:hypothetical protein
VDNACINTNQNNTLETNDIITIIPEKNCLKPIENYDILDLDNAINSYHVSAVKFTLSLLDNNNFSRKDVFEIQRKIEKYIIKSVKNLISSCTQKTVKEPISLSYFQTISTAFTNTFNFCNSEFSLNNWLVRNNLFQNVQEFNINDEINLVSDCGEIIYGDKTSKGVLLPLHFQFKKTFEHNDNLANSLSLYEQLINNSNEQTQIKHFIQGELWKKKILPYQNKILIPYFMYIDDFEINNPLGSHASVHSISAIYYSFPLTDQSKLVNIYLAALIKAVDMKHFGNDSCLNKLICQINDLEVNGFIIDTPCGTKEVHFILGLFLGDNLGLNSICEFSRSFSANYFCRFCKADKTLAHHLSKENSLLLRNPLNYADDVRVNDLKQTGVYKESILNKIISFHVTSNYSVDIMYDIFEGICHYNMCHIINYYTETVKIFSLELLNYRKQNFNYGPIEVGNMSPIIKLAHIKKFHLKMSATEMMTFVFYFSLMVGDLIPEDDTIWLFFLNFIEIIEILLSSQLSNESIFNLQRLIEKHNSEYVSLFKDTLKPKHHLLVHYPTIIKNSGPPKHFWCFRFEAKHKEMKSYAHSITSRKNIPLTLAKKFQYKYANQILNSTSSKINTNKIHIISSNYSELIARVLNLTSD